MPKRDKKGRFVGRKHKPKKGKMASSRAEVKPRVIVYPVLPTISIVEPKRRRRT